MFEKIKERIQNTSKPPNPFVKDPLGKSIYDRLLSLEPDKARAEFETYNEVSQQAYRDYIRAEGTKDLLKTVTGVALVGTLAAGAFVLLSGGDDEDEEDDEEDEDDLDEENAEESIEE